MNQRSRNRSRNPAVPFGQLVECSNSRRIAQHHGDLPATGHACRLPLSAGLGLGHSASCRRTSRANGRFGLAVTAATMRSISGRFSSRTAASNLAIHSAATSVVSWSNMAILRSGPIPLMDESYIVTSDVSTTILQVAE